MKRDDGHVTLPVMGPKREDVELAASWEHTTRDDELPVCTDDDMYKTYNDIAHEMAGKRKALMAERDEIIKPINAGVARIRSMYKPVLESLTAAESRVKGAMVTYQLDVKRRREEAELATKKAIAQGDHKAMVQHVTQATTPSPLAAGTHVRRTWKIRVTDESKVPREFLTVDTAAIKRYAIAHAWANAPDGVEFYQEEGIALR